MPPAARGERAGQGCAASVRVAAAPSTPRVRRRSWTISLAHEGPGFRELAGLRKRRRAMQELSRIRLVRWLSDAAPVLGQEGRLLGQPPTELLEGPRHVAGPANVLPIGTGHFVLRRSGFEGPLADARLLLWPDAVGIIEGVIHRGLRPE